ncbi:MAG: gamma-glutamylcyclotransferase family protein [Planctomycetota bacterium]
MPLVFVYGTLLRGERNHALLAGATFAGEGRTIPAFELADLGPYPTLVAGGRVAVEGEVWEIDGATLARLDELEEVPTLFQRKRIPLEDGRVVEAYLMPSEATAGAKRIAGGDWKKR